MGMFDRVNVTCPRCGGLVEFQSKAGACVLADYGPGNAPPAIMEDLDGEVGHCEDCGTSHLLKIEEVTVRRLTIA
jgi:hypothetical protein